MADGIQLNVSNLYSMPGMLKLFQLILGILIWICVGSNHCGVDAAGTGFIWFTSITAFVNTFIVALLIVLSVVDLMQNFPWTLTGVIYTAIWTVCYFVTIWLCVAGSANGAGCNNAQAALGFAAFFSILAFLAYGLDWLVQFRKWREGPSPPIAPPYAGSGQNPESGYNQQKYQGNF